MDRAVTMALGAKNKLGFVNGSLTTPKKKEDIPTWQLCNDLVTSWILHSVSTEIRPSKLYPDTTTQIWSDLKDSFSKSNARFVLQYQHT
jgi:hypothetical protein